MSKPILCIDFDGVIHSYGYGWQSGKIYGTIVPGFFKWLGNTQEHFKPVIYSSRSGNQKLKNEMMEWFHDECMFATNQPPQFFCPGLEFADKKPPAFLTIDDRAIQFKGDWEASELTVEALLNFKPWTR